MAFNRIFKLRRDRRYIRRNPAKYRKTAVGRKYGKRRTYRKRPMSKRRILNTTSRKKRNGMLTWTNTTATGASQTIAQSNAYVTGAQIGFFLWCPTAMDLDANSVIRNPASRTASTIYAKGLAEHVRMQTSSGIPWFHRRICFTIKGDNSFNTVIAGDSPTVPQQPYVDTSNGIQRLWLNSAINNVPNTLASMQGVLFKGAQNVDWSDFIIAPVDTSRVTLKFDKTWTMQSGNNSGVIRERKLWHPMNKNLVYDEDETGQVETSRYYSTESKAGMGDYYVLDLFSAGAGGSSADQLLIAANSTMYWHEK